MMKKFTLLSLGVILVGGFATAAPQKLSKEKFTPVKHQPSETLILKGDKKFKSHSGNLNTRAEAEPILTPIIEEAPGEPINYKKSTGGYTDSWFGVYYEEGVYPATINWDDNDVYFESIITSTFFKTYVKGTLAENIITLPLPQTILFDDEEGWGVNVAVVKETFFEEDGEEYYDYVWQEDITSVTYTVDEDGTVTLNLPEDEGYALGLIYADYDPDYNGYWAYYTEDYQIYEISTDVPVEMPENVETEPYVIYNGEFGWEVSVAFDDDEVYFKGLSYEMPDGVFMGTLSTVDGKSIVSIPQGQFVGVYENVYYVYTNVAYLNPDYDEEDLDSEYYILAPADVTYNLVYDAETQTFVSEDPDVYFLFNTAKDSVYYLDLFNDIKLSYQDDFAGTPQNPDDLYFTDYAEMFGFNMFSFTIPIISTDDTLLDADCLYYRIYVDGDLLEIEEELALDMAGYDAVMYEGITEPTTEIPLSFNNYNDIFVSGNNVIFGLYMEGYITVGVQSVYKYDGEVTESEIVTLDIESGETSAIDSINGEEIVTKEYFNLQGQKVNRMQKGIMIERSTLSNGKVVSRKIMGK